MITTLLAHEFRRTKDLTALVAGAAIALALAGSLLTLTGWPLLSTLGMVLAVVAVAGMLPLFSLGLAFEYWRSAYGRIGYFTQSLPVKGSTIYLVRLLHGFIVSVAGSVLTVLLAIPVVLAAASRETPPGMSVLAYVSNGIQEILAGLPSGASAAIMVAWVLVTWAGLVFYYAAATLGSGPILARLGVVGPFIAYALLYLLSQALFFISILAVPVGLTMRGGALGFESVNYLQAILDGGDPQAVPFGFIPVAIIGTLVLIAWTARSWDRNLSLR